MMETQLALQDIRDRIEGLHKAVVQLIIDEMPKNRKSETVIGAVLEYSGMTMKTLTESRKSGLVFYKRIMCYILYDYCQISLEQIAEKVKLSNHATVLHHVNKMRWWMSNPQYAPGDLVTATRNILYSLGYEKRE